MGNRFCREPLSSYAVAHQSAETIESEAVLYAAGLVRSTPRWEKRLAALKMREEMGDANVGSEVELLSVERDYVSKR